MRPSQVVPFYFKSRAFTVISRADNSKTEKIEWPCYLAGHAKGLQILLAKKSFVLASRMVRQVLQAYKSFRPAGFLVLLDEEL